MKPTGDQSPVKIYNSSSLVAQGEITFDQARQQWSKKLGPVVWLQRLEDGTWQNLLTVKTTSPNKSAQIEPVRSEQQATSELLLLSQSKQPLTNYILESDKTESPHWTLLETQLPIIPEEECFVFQPTTSFDKQFLATTSLNFINQTVFASHTGLLFRKFYLKIRSIINHLDTFAWRSAKYRLPKINFSWQNKVLQNSKIISNLMIGSSVALILFFVTPMIFLEGQNLWRNINSQVQNWQWTTSSHSQNQSSDTPLTSPSPSPLPKIASSEDVFSISIPSLDITSVVIPNVDPTSSNQYTQALKQGIAHAKGSGLPDQLELNKTIYLFAHSTDAPWNILRYNAQFYALKDAEIGQEIELTFWSKKYNYEITAKDIVPANDTSYLNTQMEEERLILQTCYPPGTTTKRLVVIAKRIDK